MNNGPSSEEDRDRAFQQEVTEHLRNFSVVCEDTNDSVLFLNELLEEFIASNREKYALESDVSPIQRELAVQRKELDIMSNQILWMYNAFICLGKAMGQSDEALWRIYSKTSNIVPGSGDRQDARYHEQQGSNNDGKNPTYLS